MTLIDLQPLFDFLGRFTGGPENALVIVLAAVKIGILLGHVLGIIPLIIWLERKIIAFVQDRPGPNRVGPFGILQGIVDGVKLLMKEDFIPSGADRSLYLLAPALVLVPAFLGMCIIPFGPVIEGQLLFDIYTLFGLQGMWTGQSQLALAVTNPNVGILYVFAITSVAVYGITLAGWSSENKWSLLGGIRASAQMVSYEISLSLSIIGVLLVAGSLNLYDIIGNQDGGMIPVLHWNVWAQPVAFLIFLVAIFAETNRLPFDLAEGEAELTGGFHTEYSSMKFALFFLAEYANMITASAICATLFFGGYLLIPQEMVVNVLDGILGAFAGSQAGLPYSRSLAEVLAILGAPLGLALKIFLFMVLFIVVRAIWPRMRYDQVMSLGWKVLLVAAIANLVVTALGMGVLTWVGVARAGADASPEAIQASIDSVTKNWKFTIGIVTFAILVVVDRWHYVARRKRLTSKYRNYALVPATKVTATAG